MPRQRDAPHPVRDVAHDTWLSLPLTAEGRAGSAGACADPVTIGGCHLALSVCRSVSSRDCHLSVCLCLSLSLSLSLSFSFPLSVSLCLCLSTTLSVCLSLCLSVCVSTSLSVCLSVCLFPAVCVSLSLPVSLSLSVSLAFPSFPHFLAKRTPPHHHRDGSALTAERTSTV